MNIERHEGWDHHSWIAVVGIVAGLHPVFLEGQAGKPLTLWLPYASGSSAACGQGALSNGTHRGLHAWDFILAEGEPVVAAARGRVIHVTNNRRATGSNDFDLANHIFVDVGDGRFVTYTHHKAVPRGLLAVGMVECISHRRCNLHGLIHRESLLTVDPVAESFAFHVRHHIEQEAISLTGIEQRQHIRMLELRRRLDLGQETLGPNNGS